MTMAFLLPPDAFQTDGTEINSAVGTEKQEQGERRRPLLEAVDCPSVKQGINTVYFAGAHGVVPYAPMRIAFNPIPDPDTER